MQNSPSDHINKIRHSHQSRDVEYLWNQLIKGDRSALSRAITLVESSSHDDRSDALELIERALSSSNKSVRLGVTGVPGVGKSTFIEALGKHLIENGKDVAVLAVDPSSSKTRGSILGDKTRMPFMANSPNSFVRPSPSGNDLGGVTRSTRESIMLCEAAGFDVIIIETVGVGQSETAVSGMVDFFLLLLLAGGGDELQGIKRGIMELAHGLVINKADGDNIKAAKLAKAEYTTALKLLPPLDTNWDVPVQLCSSLEGTGISEIWDSVNEFSSHLKKTGIHDEIRTTQTVNWLYDSFRSQSASVILQNPRIKEKTGQLEQAVRDKKISASRALEDFLLALKELMK